MVAEAIEIGRFLAQARAQICHNDKFVTWLENNIRFSQRAAYRYLALYKYQSKIASAHNLTEAYKFIETLDAQEKKTETQKARARVKEYLKTGRKPEGWRRGTDDNLAQEEKDLNARIQSTFETMRKEAEEREARTREYEAEVARLEAERKKAEADCQYHKERAESFENIFFNPLNRQEEIEVSSVPFKQRIELSAVEKNNQYYTAVLDYLADLPSDNRRIEACHNFIKICKRVSIQLQTENATETA
jgi:hypothetical protein